MFWLQDPIGYSCPDSGLYRDKSNRQILGIQEYKELWDLLKLSNQLACREHQEYRNNNTVEKGNYRLREKIPSTYIEFASLPRLEKGRLVRALYNKNILNREDAELFRDKCKKFDVDEYISGSTLEEPMPGSSIQFYKNKETVSYNEEILSKDIFSKVYIGLSIRRRRIWQFIFRLYLITFIEAVMANNKICNLFKRHGGDAKSLSKALFSNPEAYKLVGWDWKASILKPLLRLTISNLRNDLGKDSFYSDFFKTSEGYLNAKNAMHSKFKLSHIAPNWLKPALLNESEQICYSKFDGRVEVYGYDAYKSQRSAKVESVINSTSAELTQEIIDELIKPFGSYDFTKKNEHTDGSMIKYKDEFSENFIDGVDTGFSPVRFTLPGKIEMEEKLKSGSIDFPDWPFDFYYSVN